MTFNPIIKNVNNNIYKQYIANNVSSIFIVVLLISLIGPRIIIYDFIEANILFNIPYLIILYEYGNYKA